jgi:hypothetical protein
MTRLFIFLLGLMLWSGEARADYAASPIHIMCNGSGTYRDVHQDACQYVSSSSSLFGKPVPYAGGVQIADAYVPSPGVLKCKYYYTANKSDTPGISSCTSNWSCPYGGTLNLNGTTPMCIGGDPPPPPTCTDLNPFIRKFYYTTGGPYIAPDHYGTCVVTALEMLVCRVDTTGTYCMWKVKRTGQTWTGQDVPGNGSTASDAPEVKTDPQTKSPSFDNPPADPKICPNCVPCPAGSVQAGVDSSGIPICMGTGTAPPDPPKTPTTTTGPTTTTTNADGSTTATQTTTQANSDGSTTTTKTTTTTGADGTVTVSKDVTVSNTSSGSAGRTDTPSTDQNNLCKQNPNLTICTNSSVSGTCGSITCTGDAIQCATLRAAAQIQCKQQSDEDTLKAGSAYSLGSAVMNGADPQASALPSASKADVVQMQAIDQSGWLGGGSYFKDKTISLPDGRSFVLPLSQGESLMLGLRYVTMIVSALVCFKIVRGTFSSSGV